MFFFDDLKFLTLSLAPDDQDKIRIAILDKNFGLEAFFLDIDVSTGQDVVRVLQRMLRQIRNAVNSDDDDTDLED